MLARSLLPVVPRPLVLLCAGSLLCPSLAPAQWPNYPTPGVPRAADGAVALDAPAPRLPSGLPDLSGVWVAECGIAFGDACFTRSLFFDLARGVDPADVVMTPWAAGIADQRRARDHVDDPYGYCLPPGVPRINFGGAPFKILQTPHVTALLYETLSGSTFRQVFTDGRSLPSSAEPTWLGYSIGRWERDTFVVETTGFLDGGWIDTLVGRPHSDALRVIERFTRTRVGRMELAVTIDDPKAFLKPWTTVAVLNLLPDAELIESFCDAHDKTMEHRQIDPAPPEPPSPR